MSEPVTNLQTLDESREYLLAVFESAFEKAKKAVRRFPQPNYVLLKVAEEAGETVQAAVHYAEDRDTWDNVEAEAIQTIAMLMRLLVEGDRINGVVPPERPA